MMTTSSRRRSLTRTRTPDVTDPNFVPDGEAGGDGPEAPLIPDDLSSLVEMESPVDIPVEPAAEQRAAGASGDPTDLERLVAERTSDLQRLQAEYVNYKRRVDRDRDLSRQLGVEKVIRDLLPVLDSIEMARSHDDLDGGFRLVADELEKVTAKYGLVMYGEVGDEFDPNLHEALLHMPHSEPVSVTTISAVMQKGAMLGEKVVRPARVGVVDPG